MAKVPTTTAGAAKIAKVVANPLAKFPGSFTRQQGAHGRMGATGHTATVFGCTGFLGRYLVHQLAKTGTQVVVPYRAGSDDVRHLKVMGDLGRVIPLRFDAMDTQSLVECMVRAHSLYTF